MTTNAIFGSSNHLTPTMDIYTEPGSTVIFTCKHGYPNDRSRAIISGLVEGREYIVDRVDVGSFSSTVYLKGYKSGFNTVMFTNKD